MTDLIMFSTDDYSHSHSKQVLVKLGNPCNNQKAIDWFYERRDTTEGVFPMKVYHGALVMDEDTAYESYNKLIDKGITIQWL